MFRLNPLTRKRLRNFMRIRRARWSLLVLGLLFLLSLGAELLSNSDPLILYFGGRLYFPAFQHLTQRDLLGETEEAESVDYRAFVATEAFGSDPHNRVVWAPLRFSPGDVADAAGLSRYNQAVLSVVPEYHAARLNLTSELRIVRPVNCGYFFPGAGEQLEGELLAEHWQVPKTLLAVIEKRLKGASDSEHEFVISHSLHTDLQAKVSLPQVSERILHPTSVRLSFQQLAAVEPPFQLVFVATSDGGMEVKSKKLWQRVPESARLELSQLAEESFKDLAPQRMINWGSGKAGVSGSLRSISWPFPPVPGHWMGIDSAGRDVAARIIYGMRTAMVFGVILASWAMVFGLLIGAIQGYFGGWIDVTGQRLTEIWSALPFIYVMIFAGAAIGRSFWLLLICYSLFNWIGISYYARAEFLRLRSRTFVEAARCQGASSLRIILVHILPNALTPLITLFPFTLIGAIGTLAALDFLGFGLPPLAPSWGELLQQARLFRWAWWLILFPSVALFTVMLLAVFVGEGLRDAFDPRQQTRME